VHCSVLCLESTHIAQDAFRAIGARFVRVTATFALTIDVFAFSERQILEQIFHAAFAPVGSGAHHGLDFLDQRLTDECGPVAVGAVDVRDGANVGATRTVVAVARFLVHVNVKASVFLLTFTATDTETAQTAFVR